MEHCHWCETKPEGYWCPVCKMTGPEIAAKRKTAEHMEHQALRNRVPWETE